MIYKATASDTVEFKTFVKIQSLLGEASERIANLAGEALDRGSEEHFTSLMAASAAIDESLANATEAIFAAMTPEDQAKATEQFQAWVR